MPIDPDIIKRNLYNLHIEDLFDPSIAYLFRDKRKELDQMMTMLSERGKEGFLLAVCRFLVLSMKNCWKRLRQF